MIKPGLSTFCFLMLSTGVWADPHPSSNGIMILTSASGLDARNVAFGDQIWLDFDGGTLIGTDGQKSVFAKKDIGRVIYFNSHYYALLDNDERQKSYRAGIQAREIVVNTNFVNLTAANDLQPLQASERSLNGIAHQYPTLQALIQPQFDLLRDDIAKLSAGQSLSNGQWISHQEAVTRTTSVVGETNKPVTFKTKDGKKFENATVTITETGLSVLTSDGGASVQFDQLPDDISAFPQLIRGLIAQKRRVAQAKQPSPLLPIPPEPASASVTETSNLPIPASPANPAGSKEPILSAQVQYGTTADANKSCPQDLPITKFESAIISNFSQEEITANQSRSKTFEGIRADQGRSDGSDYFVPTFSDDFPPSSKAEGKNAIETVQYINSKLIDSQIIYYDSKLKTFVSGRLAFTTNGRVRLEKWPIITFNPSDLNPEKIEQTTVNNETLVWVCTTNNKKAIGGIEFSGVKVHSDGFSLPVEDTHDAQSMSNAVAHLIQLYGGKPEDF